jgi:hypothetical protein
MRQGGVPAGARAAEGAERLLNTGRMVGPPRVRRSRPPLQQQAVWPSLQLSKGTMATRTAERWGVTEIPAMAQVAREPTFLIRCPHESPPL